MTITLHATWEALAYLLLAGYAGLIVYWGGNQIEDRNHGGKYSRRENLCASLAIVGIVGAATCLVMCGRALAG